MSNSLIKRLASGEVFKIGNAQDLKRVALEVFHFQAKANPVYKDYLSLLKIDTATIQDINQIPFLPIEFFKTHKVIVDDFEKDLRQTVFTSSGTTRLETSKHYVAAISIYEQSFLKCFELFYGPLNDYCILALLPSYLEREGSSLVYMMNNLIELSTHQNSGFYLHNHKDLFETLAKLKQEKQKTWLIGVSYALLDFVEEYKINFPDLIVVETGGMKGKRQELIRNELHEKLMQGFGVSTIHSEYGMTELLSQAYSQGNGIFKAPPWMKIVIHQGSDPFQLASVNQTGIISVIDLANIYSCSFITTQDLGKLHDDNTFEVLGRSDFSDLRGCNLMIE